MPRVRRMRRTTTDQDLSLVFCQMKTTVVLQPLRWCCVKCVIHHERDVREEQHHLNMWREQAIIE